MAKDESITMRVSSDVKEKLRAEAEKQGRTLSNLIVMILKEAVSK